VIDDVVEGLEDAVDSQFWRMNCPMFSWLLSSGDLAATARARC